MPEAHEFGALVPVCTGKLNCGGRELLFGEHVPEAIEWPQHIRKLHVEMGNLTFVSRAQAEEMVAKAEGDRQTAMRIDLERRAKALRGACQSLTPALQRARAEASTLAKKMDAADKAAGQAEALLRDFLKPPKVEGKPPPPPPTVARLEDVGKKIEAIEVEQAKIIAAPPVEEAKPPAPATPAVTIEPEQAKAAAKERLNAMVVELSTPEALGITEDYGKRPYRELQKIAAEMGLKTVGKSKSKMVDDVVTVVKAKRLAEMQREVAEKAIQEGVDAVGEAAGVAAKPE